MKGSSKQNNVNRHLQSISFRLCSDVLVMEKKSSAAAASYASMKEEYDLEVNQMNSLKAKLEDTSNSVIKTENYILELEEKLREARERLIQLNSEKSSLQRDINFRQSRQTVLNFSLHQ